jgi:glyoxylase-like metal-dependent hydrolase (beta-lactamase superfamily II)
VIELLDLGFLGEEGLIGTYLLDLDAGPTLVDCGPSSTLPALEAGLAGVGVSVEELRHLLLTHIHLDHAGAAGSLVARNPDLRVHVSEAGAPHLTDPSRLERSARRLYGEAHDALWGPLLPVPEANIDPVGTTTVGLESFPTPGHAVHHASYLTDSGVLFSGDVAGVRLSPDGFVFPTTPPPDVDLELWHRSLDQIELRTPARLALPHFGYVEEPPSYLAELRRRLMLWAERVRRGLSEDEFVALAGEEIAAESPEEARLLGLTDELRHSYLGLERYWSTNAAGA